MKATVKLAGASYQSVEKVILPLAAGGTASYINVSDTTATAADVKSGKTFYDSSGKLTTGTNTDASYTDFDSASF